MMKSAACIVKSDIPIYEGLIEMFPSPNMHTTLSDPCHLLHGDVVATICADQISSPGRCFFSARSDPSTCTNVSPEGTCSILCVSRFNLQADWLFVLQSERSVDLRVAKTRAR
jgi:hypothetical protein